MPNRFRLDTSQMKCAPCDLIFLVEQKPDAFPFELDCPNCGLPANYMRSLKIVHDVEHIDESTQKGSGITVMERKVEHIRWKEKMAKRKKHMDKMDLAVAASCGVFIGVIVLIVLILVKF